MVLTAGYLIFVDPVDGNCSSWKWPQHFEKPYAFSCVHHEQWPCTKGYPAGQSCSFVFHLSQWGWRFCDHCWRRRERKDADVCPAPTSNFDECAVCKCVFGWRREKMFGWLQRFLNRHASQPSLPPHLWNPDVLRPAHSERSFLAAGES